MAKKSISRRDFIKGMAASAVGMAGFGALSVLTGAETAQAAAVYTPGTYTAAAKGIGDITVSVTFDETSIVGIELDLANETPEIGQAAKDVLIEQIMNAQGVAIDGVSGATVTTNAVQRAVSECIAKANGSYVEGMEIELPSDESKTKISDEDQILDGEIEASSVVTEEITEFAAEHEFDVVIVGAGTTGIPAALSAIEAGASVCVLQKQATVIAQGHLAACVDLSQSTDIGIAEYIHELHSIYDHRGNIKLHQQYAWHSQEAIDWFIEKLGEVEFTNFMESDSKTHEYDDGSCHLRGTLFPKQMLEPMTALAPLAQEKGVEIFYETPAVQLVKDGDRITGVIGKTADGYVLFKANKGVILATGDYQNNEAMVNHYVPDAGMYGRKQSGKTGDGHLMGMLAGAKIEPVGHCKMIHATGAGVMREEPLLALNLNGERFLYEDIEYGRRCTVLRDQPENTMISLFDANYSEYVKGWGSNPEAPTTGNASEEKLASFVENGTVQKADTLEELFEAVGIPVEAGLASVERYNELCAQGMDLDFGKSSKYMKPVDTAPFYAQVRKFEVSAIPAGLLINENGQCVDGEEQEIPGLFAAGNCSGCFYGDVDYSLSTMGLSVGRCITFGYLTGRYVASL